MPKFDVICVGNAKIDLFLSIHQASKHLRLNTETNELCFHSGEKIAVDKCEFLLGGNAANVAVGLSRLGLKSSIYAEIGDDELSHKIINTLKKENVHIEFVKRSKEQESSISVIINFKNERTIFSEHVHRKHDFTFNNLSTKWIYLTSLGKEWKSAYAKVVDFVKQTKTHLAFNPGTLQINEGRESIANILSETNILFVNKEEATKVLSIKYKVLSIKDLLTQLKKLGPKIVVITDGKNGSYAIDERAEILTHAIIKTEIVERTGAGDAYASGFMAATLHGQSIEEAMNWGAINSASVIEQIGAQKGLLTIGQIKETL